jgi:hypothetical protein
MPLGKTLEEIVSTRKTLMNICAYQALYNNLAPEDKKALDAAWEINLPMNVILIALRKEGHKIGKETIINHRKGQCKCPK